MLERRIPRTGETLPAVGLGTWQVFDVAGNAAEMDQARATLAVFGAHGGRLVDSSPMYGSAEAVTGQLAAELGVQEKLFVATKVWTSGKHAGIRQMEDSMAKLRVDRLDLMQVHNLVDADTHLATLADWKAEGRVRYVGVTHYHAGAHADLERFIEGGAIDTVQVNYSLAEPEAEHRLLRAAADRGTAVIVNRPFASGAMLRRVRGAPLPDWAAEIGCTSWSQALLKWILAHPAVTCVIPATRNPKHAADNLGAGPSGRCRTWHRDADEDCDGKGLALAVKVTLAIQGGRRVGTRLSAEATARYERDGYHFPVRVLSTAEAWRCRERLEQVERDLGGSLRGIYRVKPHLLFTWLADLVRHPAILDAIEDVIGPDILCWNSSFFTKEAESPGFVSWHQDATYWGLSEPDVVTAWLAFTESTPANGNMRVVPGSHRALVPHVDTFHPDNLLSRGQEITVDVDEAEAVDIVLAPGEMSLHHVLIVHGSGANPSADRRIGFAIRYVPTRIRQTAGPRDSATLVRGTDAFGHFDLEPRPETDLDPAMQALHAEISDQQVKILYRGTGRTSF